MQAPAAVFFDVDFTLIHPGPRFQASGYQASCARHGIEVDPSRFEGAVEAAAPVLDADDHSYNAEVFLRYTGRIIELMGGRSPAVATVAREMYEEWAQHRHFVLYDDVIATLRRLHGRGLRLGLISNSHRPLDSFQSHFDLDGLIAVAVSSFELGLMKPHPTVFNRALELMGVAAEQAVMVGDSLTQDIDGARKVGMRGVLLARDKKPRTPPPDTAIISTLHELPDLL